jgi:uracil-DNA glycosylase
MIKLINDSYCWKNCSLNQFIQEGNIPSNWIEFFNKDKVIQEINYISNYLEEEAKTHIIYPPLKDVFKAFYATSYNDLKAVLIAQDPYFNGTSEYDGSAMGLCFSIRQGNKINPSLRNIYKELANEGIEMIENGDLNHWAKNGLLMYNMALTVRKDKAGSHSKIWSRFSQLLVEYLSNKRNINWILFGRDAIKIKERIKNGYFHCCSHPSPLSANKCCGKYSSFLGSGIFSNLKNFNWSNIKK